MVRLPPSDDGRDSQLELALGLSPDPAGEGGGSRDVRHRPPQVVRGAKWQGQTTVGLDWITCTGPLTGIARLRHLLEEFGMQRVGKARPLPFFEAAEEWTGGAVVSWTNAGAKPIVMVTLSGVALQELPAWDRVKLLKAMYTAGLKATRLDIALDYRGLGFDLAALVDQAAQRGCLIGAKRRRLIRDTGGAHGNTCEIGLRGKNGSGRFCRVYDKGLESGTEDANEWWRWEVVFSGPYVQDAMEKIVESHGTESVDDVSAGLALGAFDFREPSTSSDRHKDRRKICDWWAQLICAEPVAALSVRRTADLDSWWSHFTKTVLPTLLGMAEKTDMPLNAVFDDLVERSNVPHGVRDTMHPIVVQYACDVALEHESFAEEYA